jgi:hypothetical protein
MNINNTPSVDIGSLNLYNWDLVWLRELLQKDRYIYVLSVVLAESFRTSPNSYDYKMLQDLLSWEKTQSYTKQDFDVFLSDLKSFSSRWGDREVSDFDKHQKLLIAFEESLPVFFKQSHFDHLKNHWLKERMHRPLFAVLGSRAKQWRESDDTPAASQEDLLDILY